MGRKSKKQRPGQKTVRLWFVIMSIFMSELFVYTWCRVQHIRTGYELTQATEEKKRLLAVKQHLSIEVARLK
jgi:hypothetical protein